jgi:4-amino-4-deoxy-L-arabinose transferase-like glycosyltransferase
MPPPAPHPTSHAPRRLLIVAGAATFFAALIAFGATPRFGDAWFTTAIIVQRLLVAGAAPGAYILAAVGLGRLFRPLFAASEHALPLQACTGLAAMLTLSHLLGWAGLLGGAHGPFVGAGAVLGGAALALHQAYRALRGGGWEPRTSWTGLIGAPALAILLVGACNPPGVLWDSEFGGYDALSYHLQLPQEWLKLGAVRGLDHNVYSFLPGYLEAAFMHLGAMTFAPSAPTTTEGSFGLVAGEGERLISCQLLHASCALLAAWCVSSAAAALARRAGLERAQLAGRIAGAATLVTPWMVVTGSLAYNDTAVVLFLAGAMLAAADDRLLPWVRGGLVGLLVGAACGAKPTALFMAGVPSGILLLVFLPRRAWMPTFSAGALVGALMLAPWMIRNAGATGNPVFPFAAGLFANESGGTGHWTAEQVARFAGSHTFGGSVADRLRLLVLPDPSDPAGTRHRGMLHSQWALFFPIVLIAAGAAWIRAVRPASSSRAVIAALTAALLAQVILWLTLTHLQSRFLLPLIAPGAVLLGIACAGVPARIGVAGGALALVIQCVSLAMLFVAQVGGDPNRGLVLGPAWFSGRLMRDALATMPDDERAAQLAQLPPEIFVNTALPPNSAVYFLGDATPLYASVRAVYNTTYDRWPIEQAFAFSTDPAAQTSHLRSMGIDYVLISLGEVRRLTESGFIDPAVSEQAVITWMTRGATPVRSWPDVGRYLVRTVPPERAP